MYTIDELKRCLIYKLTKKYKGDESSLIKMLTDVKINNYKTIYSDCLFNCFIMLLREYNDRQTVDLFINTLTERL